MTTRKSLPRHPEPPPNLIEIIVAAQKVNWHYTNCCLELGYTGRVTELRSIIEAAGYSWGILASKADALAIVGPLDKLPNLIDKLAHKSPDTEAELAALARYFNWNQSAVCRHLGLKSLKAGVGYRKLKRWGYDNWTDFCVKNGKPRPPLTLELIIQAGHENEWELASMVLALQYKENGALVSWMQRNGYTSWSEFRYKHASEEYHPMHEQLTFALISEAGRANDWIIRDVETSLGYVPGAGGVRKWLKRRGYTWGEYVAKQLNLPGIPKTHKTETNLVEEDTVDSNKIAKIAARNGWHIDLTAWELDTDRKELLVELKSHGFKNWKSFYEAHSTDKASLKNEPI